MKLFHLHLSLLGPPYLDSRLLRLSKHLIIGNLGTTSVAMSSREPQNSARRSKSPHNSPHHKRPRSPNSHHHYHASHKHKRSKPSGPVHLPFEASRLHSHDFEAFKPMFELYLDIQKQKVLEELPDDEAKGRWKSFVGKWYISVRSLCTDSTWISRYMGLTFARNRGELVEGWYDPAILQKAQASNAVNTGRRSRPQDSPSYLSPRRAEESSDEDIVGPALPGCEIPIYKSDKRSGPAIPNLQDLELQRGPAPIRTLSS